MLVDGSDLSIWDAEDMTLVRTFCNDILDHFAAEMALFRLRREVSPASRGFQRRGELADLCAYKSRFD